MADPTATTGNGSTAAKNHFAKAMEEVKAGAQALGKEAQARAGEYKDKMVVKKDGLSDDAKVKSDAAKEKAYSLADDGKAKASSALASFGQMITDNAGLIDEKVGPKYGDYARGAAKSVQDAAAKLDEKSLEELGDEVKQFVQKSPGVAIGMAAAAAFLIGRITKGK